MLSKSSLIFSLPLLAGLAALGWDVLNTEIVDTEPSMDPWCTNHDFSDAYYTLDDGIRRFDTGAVPVLVPTGTPIYESRSGTERNPGIPADTALWVSDPGQDSTRMQVSNLTRSHSGWVAKHSGLCHLLPRWNHGFSAYSYAVSWNSDSKADLLAVYAQRADRLLVGGRRDPLGERAPLLEWVHRDEFILWQTGLGWWPTGRAPVCVYGSVAEMLKRQRCQALRLDRPRSETSLPPLDLGPVVDGRVVAVPMAALQDGALRGTGPAWVVGYVPENTAGLVSERFLTLDELELWRAYVGALANLFAELRKDREDITSRLNSIFTDYPPSVDAPPPEAGMSIAAMLVDRHVPGSSLSRLHVSPGRLKFSLFSPSCFLDAAEGRMRLAEAALRASLGGQKTYAPQISPSEPDLCDTLFNPWSGAEANIPDVFRVGPLHEQSIFLDASIFP